MTLQTEQHSTQGLDRLQSLPVREFKEPVGSLNRTELLHSLNRTELLRSLNRTTVDGLCYSRSRDTSISRLCKTITGTVFTYMADDGVLNMTGDDALSLSSRNDMALRKSYVGPYALESAMYHCLYLLSPDTVLAS